MTNTRVRQRRAAILAADVVGYSRLMGDDELATIGALNDCRDVFRNAIEDNSGRVVDMAGDSVLAVFDTAISAANAGFAAQERLQEYNAALPKDRRMSFRIGVNLGDIHEQADGSVYGDGVNVAARLESLAEPGGMLVSPPVHAEIAGRVPQAFFDSGERTFKNIMRPIRVWSWPRRLSSALDDGRPHVFVMVFAGRDDTEAEAGAELSEELRAHLSRLTGLEVVTDRWNAHYVVEGSVRFGGGRTRVFVRLAAVDTSQQLWSDRFSLLTDDPFEVFDKCAPSISTAVRRRVAADDADRAARMDPAQMPLEKLLAVAGCSFFKPTRDGWAGGGRLAEKALERAPDNFMALAMAAAGLGCDEWLYGYRKADEDAVNLAFDRIEKSIQQNSQCDMAYGTQALLLLYGRKRHSDALAASRRALELNPDYNMGHWSLGLAQTFSGDYAAGSESAEHAVAINVRDPYAHLYSRAAAYGHLGAGNLGEAIDWFQRADQMSPGLPPNLCGLAVSRQLDGDGDGARHAVDRLMHAVPDFHLSDLEPLPFLDSDLWSRFFNALRSAGTPQ